MNNNESYLTLIENSISKYNEKYGKNLRYEITNFPLNYQFVIYDDITPILFKSINKDTITEINERDLMFPDLKTLTELNIQIQC
jgi:hypothetical protein